MTYRQFIRTIIYERPITTTKETAPFADPNPFVGARSIFRQNDPDALQSELDSLPVENGDGKTETREIAVNQWGHDYIKGTDHLKNFADSGWTIVSEGEPQLRTLSVNEDIMLAKDVIVQADGSQSIRYHGNGRCMTLHGVRYSGGNTLFDYMEVS